MEIKLDKRFAKKLQGRFGKYDFEVGVLEDGPHIEPMSDLLFKDGKVSYATKKYKGENVFIDKEDTVSTYAGGPVRKKSRQQSGKRISEVSEENRNRLGINFYTEPFKKKSSDIIKFTDEFFKLAFGKSEKRRAENLLQAIVRNPILRGEYGPTSEATNKIKGFDRPMIDTAQLFKAIKAKCTIRGGR